MGYEGRWQLHFDLPAGYPDVPHPVVLLTEEVTAWGQRREPAPGTVVYRSAPLGAPQWSERPGGRDEAVGVYLGGGRVAGCRRIPPLPEEV